MAMTEVEIHYRREDGLHTYAVCSLTTDHPASSYGQAVLVVERNYRTSDPLRRGDALGAADLPPGAKLVAAPRDVAAVVAAGYSPVEAWGTP